MSSTLLLLPRRRLFSSSSSSSFALSHHYPPAPFFRLLRASARALYLAALWTPVICSAPIGYLLCPDLWFRLVRAAITYSGPVAIKLGQWIGSRPDLFPVQLAGLVSLQHEAPIHSSAWTRVVVARLEQEHLGCRNLHMDFDAIVGSGAVAQVYRGTLDSGRHVAVKILHPDVRHLVDADLMLLGGVVRLIDFLHLADFLNLSRGLAEFSSHCKSQLSMQQEATNLRQFRENFNDKDGAVSFPEPLFVSRDALVMSWEPGRVLSSLLEEGPVEKGKEIAQVGLKAFFRMLQKNFVHGDLHAGNILFDADSGRVAIVDCGLVVRLTESSKSDFQALFSALVRRDGAQAAVEMMERGGKQSNTNEKGFIDEMRAIFDEIEDRFSSAPLANALQRVLMSARRNRVHLDSSFVTLISSCVVLEGTGRRLDPNLSLFGLAPMLLMSQKS